MHHRQRRDTRGRVDVLVVADPEVTGPYADQRIVGGESGGGAPGREARFDVLLRDLFLSVEPRLDAVTTEVDDTGKRDELRRVRRPAWCEGFDGDP